MTMKLVIPFFMVSSAEYWTMIERLIQLAKRMYKQML